MVYRMDNLTHPVDREEKTVHLPFVSVLMPVHNEGQYIYRSLGAVLTQDYPKDRFEVLVIDGASTDATVAICRELASDTEVPVQIIHNSQKYVAAGLNLGIIQAAGEIIVRVDGHCVIAPNYLQACVRHLEDPAITGVGGAMETIGETPAARIIASAMSSVFGVGGSAFRTSKGRDMLVETVPFPAYRKADVLANGPFDEEMIRNQDDEYNYRILQNGGRLLLAADVGSKYYSRSNFRSLWRQYFQYGFFKVRVLKKHPHQMRLRQYIPALWLASLFILPLASLWLNELLWVLWAEIGLYLLALLWFSLSQVKNLGIAESLQLPLAFLILHSAYGAGFWGGICYYFLLGKTHKQFA